MNEKIAYLVEGLNAKLSSERYSEIVNLTLESVSEGIVVLGGEILKTETLEKVKTILLETFPEIRIVASDGVSILLNERTEILRVSKNLTSMHSGKSFLLEQTNQLLFGDEVALIRDEGDWIYGYSLRDGYLSYTYKKYLGSFSLPAVTHIVADPVALAFDAPCGGKIVTRVLGGTYTAILEESGEMAKIAAAVEGWVAKSALRSIADLPKDADSLRTQVCADARKLIGVPYLWGGASALGIDCSGLVQWAYRCNGIRLKRDAHLQFEPRLAVDHDFLPGDALFYGENDGSNAITHTSLSLGGWTIIHSSRSNNGVYIDDVQSVPHLRDGFIGAVRYI